MEILKSFFIGLLLLIVCCGILFGIFLISEQLFSYLFKSVISFLFLALIFFFGDLARMLYED